MTLPQCTWRGPELPSGNYPCGSPKLIVGPGGVSADTCGKCPYVNHPKVSLAEQAIKFGVASIRHLLRGAVQASDEQYASRLKACASCSSVDKSDEVWKCKECGCQLQERSLMPGKARWASEECPRGLWPKIELPTVSAGCGGCKKG